MRQGTSAVGLAAHASGGLFGAAVALWEWRRVRGVGAVCLGILGVLLACDQAEPGSASQPGDVSSSPSPPQRIILIVADTLRRDALSPYGSRLETPGLADLATRGQVFHNATASFHQTTMSMAALFTGRTPSIETGERQQPLPWTSVNWCGMARLARSDEDACVPAHLTTLAEDLKAAGYATYGVVSNRLLFRPYGYDQGFDSWVEVGEPESPVAEPQLRPGSKVDQATLALVSRGAESQLRTGSRVNQATFDLLEHRESDRFFLYVHYMDAHDHGLRPELPSYPDGVRHLDRAISDLQAGLAAAGFLEGSVLIFTSDHGEYLDAGHPLPANPRHFGNPSFESVLRVPLIVAPPIERDEAAFIRSQDIRGLVLQVAGIIPPAARDLDADELFLTEEHYQIYRRGRWKSMWARKGGQVALFDLARDPGEESNLAAAHPEILQKHRQRIETLSEALSTQRGSDSELTPADAERLRALGYLE